jgi:3-hydroxymyristoyl/3-hydroxydecanoyl-(acyl carrier protein) dehydratase
MPTTYTLHLLTTHPQITARATFPNSFPGFHGHFPNNPILPGFMHLQLALDTLKAANLPHTLKQIPTAKFTNPIPPETEIHLTLTQTTPTTYEATLTQNEIPLSTFTLIVE